MNGRRIYHARGKVLGGSSSINGMIFQRGNPMDYERWAGDPGMEQWDYAHCLPYFKRMENCLAADRDDEFRGKDGPLWLERGPATNPLFEAFFDATVEAGYPRTDDVNGVRQEGFTAFDRNVRRGRRWSAARAYLHPVLTRPNLELITNAHVTKVLFEGTQGRPASSTCTGARSTRREAETVILCGGAINTPQLLQLSGVGNADELRRLGIDVRADLPGVGENMQDHLEVYIQYACTQPVSMQKYLKKRYMLPVGAQWLFLRSGPGATNHFEGGGFARSNDDERYPNLMFHFLPIAVRYDGSRPGVRRRLPGAHRPDVLRLARLGEDHVDAIRRPNLHCGSTTCPPTRTGASGSRRSASRGTSSTSRRWSKYNGGETSPGDVGVDRRARSWTGCAATARPRCTRRARRRWASTTWRSSTRRRWACAACRASRSWTPRCSPTSRTATSTPR